MSGFAESLYFRSPHWLQNLMVSAYGYQLYRKRYTGIFEDIMVEIRAIEEMNANQVEALQAERLHRMMAYCEQNIPYYQKLLSDHGFTAEDFTQTAHIKKLPVLKKATVKNHPDWFRPKNGHKAWMLQHTSGSTGTPLSLDVDEYTYKLAMALLVRHEENAGVPFRAPRATFAGRMLQRFENQSPPFSRYNRAENQRLFSSYHLSESNFPAYRQELDNFQPRELIGYPSAISHLAGYYLEASVTPGFTPAAIVTNSETLLGWQRSKIESAFKARVYDYYGTAEYVLFAGQAEDDIYHTNPLIGLTELAPPEDGNEEYTILATTLCNTAMPLIRYDVGDTAVPHEDENKLTGNPKIAAFSGRKDDYLITPSGRKIGRTGEIFGYFPSVKEAQIIQETPEFCRLLIVLEPNAKLDESAIITQCQKKLSKELRFSIEYLNNVPRGANGKFKSVIGIQ